MTPSVSAVFARCQRPELLRRSALALLFLVSLAAQLAAQAPSDEWLSKPVDDAVYKSYLALFGYDHDVPLDVRVISTEEQDGVAREKILFTSTPGVRVTGYFFRPSGTGWQRRPAVVALHGGAGRGKESVIPTANAMVRQGFNVLAIDLQFFGERRGDLMTTFSEQEKHDKLYNQPSAYLAWVAQTVKDAGRAIDVLLAQYGASPQSIGFVGFSRGATAGVIVSAVEKRFRAVALMLSTHFDALEREHLPAACPANYIGRIAPRPLLMVNGNYDADHVKETQVQPLFQLAREPKRIVWTETGHQVLPESVQLMIDWLRDQLR